MARRQFRNLTLPVDAPRWLKHYDRTGRETHSRRIEPGVDLFHVLVLEAAALIADGWTIDIDSELKRTHPGFYVSRGDARRQISIMTEESARWQGHYRPYE